MSSISESVMSSTRSESVASFKGGKRALLVVVGIAVAGLVAHIHAVQGEVQAPAGSSVTSEGLVGYSRELNNAAGEVEGTGASGCVLPPPGYKGPVPECHPNVPDPAVTYGENPSNHYEEYVLLLICLAPIVLCIVRCFACCCCESNLMSLFEQRCECADGSRCCFCIPVTWFGPCSKCGNCWHCLRDTCCVILAAELATVGYVCYSLIQGDGMGSALG